MNYKELVKEVTRLLDKFQEYKQCIDSFTEDAAKELKVFFKRKKHYFTNYYNLQKCLFITDNNEKSSLLSVF